MNNDAAGRAVLGINGFGRIGKMLIWYFAVNRTFDEIVVNTGREVGRGLEDVVHMLGADSTYGPAETFLFGVNGRRDIHIEDADAGLISFFGIRVRVLRTARDPRQIDWRAAGVNLVIDATGRYLDPTVPADATNGSIRGHLTAGAMKVIASAPFKVKDKTAGLPDDSAMLIFGINHTEYDPARHHVLSAASCTTTGLAHMIKPLLEAERTSKILTASLSTIHASTNSQTVLDAVPATGAKDLRKTRSVFNNIILSSTGAARALEQVLPEISRVGFMADSVRIPTTTVSLINLNLTFNSPMTDKGEPSVTRQYINDVYRAAAEGSQKGLLLFSDKQNVSADLMGVPASVVIEGFDTHTRTGFLEVSSEMLAAAGVQTDRSIDVPVTHAKIFGWYDNEYGSYVTTLGKLVEYVHRTGVR
ncbi:MAG: glyceraldehyde 3-phosphate dehydrogenase NAD-binding domain-containing protein [Bacteroidota bacterium]|jgi:glyceraldehyde 3-phosphate dehydrogenase|nr:glyceraldehyde 3-phosphate dehydrogenase NAD-binding domain-containing protein [Bacteroidota bacterium]